MRHNALNPSTEHFADFDQLKPFADAYRANLEDLEHELHQAKRLVERIGESSTDSAALYCKPTTLVGFVTCLADTVKHFMNCIDLAGLL